MQYHDPEDDTAALYAAKTLAAPDAETFEHHLLVCETCRNEVRLAALVRSELSVGSRRLNPWMLGAGLALAASLLLVFTGIKGNSLESLGVVSAAPTYNGVAVRGTQTAADSLFVRAMTSYQSGDYSNSSKQFLAARLAGSDSVTTTFFLGVSSLIAGDAAAAVRELKRSSAMPQTGYTSESHYYLAKALLRLGKRDDAMHELMLAGESESVIQPAAKLLADSIRALR